MAEVQEEKRGDVGMNIDLLSLLSVDPREVKGDCRYSISTPLGPLCLRLTVDKTAQSRFFFSSLFDPNTVECEVLKMVVFNV